MQREGTIEPVPCYSARMSILGDSPHVYTLPAEKETPTKTNETPKGGVVSRFFLHVCHIMFALDQMVGSSHYSCRA